MPETARPETGRHPVAGFLARRLATGIVTLLIASVLIFLATNILPGNAAQVVLGRNATGPAVHKLEAELGLAGRWRSAT